MVVNASLSVTTNEFPNADTVLIDEFVQTQYQDDGTSVTWDDEYIKILTEKGKRDYQTLSFYFTLPYGTAQVVCLEIIKPDQTVVPVDVDTQSRVMVDESQMSANIYNPNAKILRVSVPGLEIGDILHVFSFRDTVKARVPNTWSDYTLFEATIPLQSLTYVVEAPVSLPLTNMMVRDEIPGTVSHEQKQDGDDTLIYTWKVKNVPRMFPEPNMPPLYSVVQRLLVSTIPDWEAISRWYWKLCLPHLEATTPAMEEKVNELVEGVESDDETIMRLFTFVSQQIRYMGITTEDEAPGYEPHDVSITFENRYGVCRDKAALLVAMLRMAGLEAFPVLIDTRAKKDEDVPQPYFNHAVVAVRRVDGAYQLMDPTDENAKDLLPSYLCDKSFLAATPKGEQLLTSPINPAADNMLTIKSAGVLTEQGAVEMTSTLRFDGINDNAYRNHFSRMKPEDRRKFLDARLKRVLAGAELLEYELLPEDLQDTTQPLTLSLQYRTDDYAVIEEGYALVQPPWLGRAFGVINFIIGDTGLTERKYPFYPEIACGVKESLQMELPESMGKMTSSSDSIAIDTNTLTFVQQVATTNHTLLGESEFLFKVVEFSPAEYLVLKETLKEIEYAYRRKAVYEDYSRYSLQNDMVVLNNDSTYHFVDERNWTYTNTVRKKILTYAGKKNNSELKFGYNPAWMTARLVHAIVENTDGTLHEVVPEEINMMDAAWVGSAPRYPAAKVMVVSLPGVEVGSIIEYTVAYEMKDLPFFSTMQTFRRHEPVQSKSVKLYAPSSMQLTFREDLGREVKKTVEQDDEMTVYTWTARDQFGLKNESQTPPWWTFNPYVMMSSGNWDTYMAEVRSNLIKASDGQEECQKVARDITSISTNDDERIRVVRDYIAKHIRITGPGLASLPFSAITSADQTLREGYGNSTDKAIVLYTLLSAAGYHPEFVLLSSWGYLLDDLNKPFIGCPDRDFFNVVDVRLKIGDDYVYFAGTDQYDRLGVSLYDGSPAMTMDGDVFTVKVSDTYRDASSAEYKISLSDDGDARITQRQYYQGPTYGSFYKRYAEMPPEDRRRHFLELVSSISQSAEAVGEFVTDYVSYPGVREFTVNVPRYAVRDGEYLYVKIPAGLRQAFRLDSDERTFPWFYSTEDQSKVSYRIILPEGTEQLYMLPQDIDWNGPDGLGYVQFITTTEMDTDGQPIVSIHQERNLQSAIIGSDEYESLLYINRRTASPSAGTLLIGIGEARVTE